MFNQDNQNGQRFSMKESVQQKSDMSNPYKIKKRSPIWIVLGVFLILSIMYSLFMKEDKQNYQPTLWNEVVEFPNSEKAVRILDIKGMILYDEMVPSVHRVLSQVEKSDWIHGLIIRINSPGGGAMASKAIHDMILKFKAKTKKPVIALMTEMATSGGYYIACASDEIIASPVSLTGSIGVLFNLFNFTELFKKIGVKQNLFKSGPFKATGADMGRHLNKQEKILLQSLIDEFYMDFIDSVYRSRQKKMSRKQLKGYADGRVFTGKTALKIGLIDKNGYLDTAVEIMKKKLNVKGSLAIIQDKKMNLSLLNMLLGNQSSGLNNLDSLLNHKMYPLYLYTGTQFK